MQKSLLFILWCFLSTCYLQTGQNKTLWRTLNNFPLEFISKFKFFSETTVILLHTTAHRCMTYSHTNLTLNFLVKFILYNSWLVYLNVNLSCPFMSFFSGQCRICLIMQPVNIDRLYFCTTPLTALLSSPTSLVCPTLPSSLCGVSCFCSSLFPGYVSIFHLLSPVLAPLTASSPATVNHSTPPASWRESSSLSGSLCNGDGTRHRGVAPPRGLH